MLVLDTSDLPATERAEAVQTTVSASASSSMATFDDQATMWARLTLTELGPGRVFNVESGGMTLRRSPAQARSAQEHRIALAVPLHTPCRLHTRHVDTRVEPRQMLLVDLSEAYEFGWTGDGSSFAFQVLLDDLRLPVDVIHRAAGRIGQTDLYPLVRDHIVNITTKAHTVREPGAAYDVGATTVALMRALITGAARAGKLDERARADALTARILTWIDQHLLDADLSPQRIAAGHHISLRQLYKTLERSHIQLEQHIIDRRLDAARSTIRARPDSPIAVIAQLHGFTSPSHFARRFRQRYGHTPQQFRQSTAASTPPTQ